MRLPRDGLLPALPPEVLEEIHRFYRENLFLFDGGKTEKTPREIGMSVARIDES